MAFGNPTQAQIDATVAVKQGRTLEKRNSDGYIFASGILEPEHSDFLSYQYPQYLATALFDRLNRWEGKAQSVWSWSEMDRTRKSCTPSAVVANGNLLDVTTDVVIGTDADSAGYYIIGDQLISVTGVNFLVTAVGTSGSGASTVQTITVKRADGAAAVTGDIPATTSLGHLGSAFGEYSTGPDGRMFLPNERHNKMQIIRRATEISGDAETDRTYFGDSWMYENDNIMLDEFARDRENIAMFGQMSADSADETQTTEGIVTSIAAAGAGITTTYGANVTESDIQDHIKALKISSPAKEYLCLCGAQFQQDASNALKEYAIGGAQNYGPALRDKNLVGLSLDGYKFMGITVYFVHYNTFDDMETLPSGDGSAAQVDYSNFSLWLNMGKDKGKDLISLKYKELNGKQRKLRIKHIEGMMSDSDSVANDLDGSKTSTLTQFGPEVRNLNQHGILRSEV